MTLSPIFDASLAIKIHFLGVLVAVIFVLLILLMRKGTKTHKLIGRIWVSAMIITALSSFWINEIDHFMGFSAIHIISIYVLFSSFRGVQHIRNGNVKAHKATMTAMAIGGLFGAGIFAFSPGRIMHSVFFAGF